MKIGIRITEAKTARYLYSMVSDPVDCHPDDVSAEISAFIERTTNLVMEGHQLELTDLNVDLEFMK